MRTLKLIIDKICIYIFTYCYITSTLTKYTLFSSVSRNVANCPINRIQYGALSKGNSVFTEFFICSSFFSILFSNIAIF